MGSIHFLLGLSHGPPAARLNHRVNRLMYAALVQAHSYFNQFDKHLQLPLRFFSQTDKCGYLTSGRFHYDFVVLFALTYGYGLFNSIANMEQAVGSHVVNNRYLLLSKTRMK